MSNLTDLLPAGAGGKQVSFVASGTIGNGVTVVLNSDGTVAAVSETAESIGSPQTFQASARSDWPGCAYDSNTNKIVIFYLKQASNQVWGVVGTVSGSSISFGTPILVVNSIAVYDVIGCLYDPVSQNVVYGWRQGTSSGLQVIIATVSGTTLTLGSPTAIDTGSNENGASMVYDTNANKILFIYPDATNSQYGTGRVGTVSGRTISFGSKTVFNSAASNRSAMAYDSVAQKIVMMYNNGGPGMAQVATISGTGVSFGTAIEFGAAAGGLGTKSSGCAYDVSSGKTVLGYAQTNDGNGVALTASISGTSLTLGTKVTFAATNIQTPLRLVYDANAQKVIAIYSDATNSYSLRANALSVSGSTITVGAQAILNSTSSNYPFAAYDSTANKTIIPFSNNSVDGEAVVYSPSFTNLSATTFIGISDAAISDTASGSVTIKGGVASNTNISTPLVTTVNNDFYWLTSGAPQAIAQAYDPVNNKFVVMGREGNIPRAYVGTVSGVSISYGSLVYPGGAINGSFFNQSLTYDDNAGKFVFCYQNVSNSYYGTAVVGTISGTTTTWGTPVVYASVNSAFNEVVYDSNAQKVAVFYKDQTTNNKGVAIVGTVSGTSISFGSSVDFLNSNTNDFALAYDSNTQKIFVAVTDYGASLGRAYVATISGTSISFGTPTTFLSGVVASNSLAAAYDSTNQKCILAYTDDGPDEGYMVVGTISGTSVSFGSATQYAVGLSDKPNINCMAYNATSQLINIIYNMPSGADQGIRTTFASVSGTTVTIEADVSVKAGGTTEMTGNLYDPDTGNIIVFYNDPSLNDANSNVVTTSTALVTNTDYYVQTDGSLSTTVSSVLAGKALSSTSINLDYTT